MQYLQNVGTVQARGADLKIQAYLSPKWQITGMVAYNDSVFARSTQTTHVTGDKVPLVPAFLAHEDISYTTYLSGGGYFKARTGFDWIGKTFFDQSNTVSQNGYGLLNAEMIWAKDDHFKVILYGENLTNKNYAVYGFPFGSFGNVYQLALGRTIGLRMQVSL